MLADRVATRYAQIFEILADYQALQLLDYLRIKNDYVSTEELGDVIDMTERKAEDACERLRRERILDRNTRDGDVKYKMLDSSIANRIESVLMRLD